MIHYVLKLQRIRNIDGPKACTATKKINVFLLLNVLDKGTGAEIILKNILYCKCLKDVNKTLAKLCTIYLVLRYFFFSNLVF